MAAHRRAARRARARDAGSGWSTRPARGRATSCSATSTSPTPPRRGRRGAGRPRRRRRRGPRRDHRARPRPGAALGVAAAGEDGRPPALPPLPRHRAARRRRPEVLALPGRARHRSTAGPRASRRTASTSSSYPPRAHRATSCGSRTAAVLGLDVTGLDTEARRPNDSLGLVEAELLRRVNERIPRPRRSPALTRHVKGTFVPDALAGSADRESFVLPARHHGWVLERSRGHRRRRSAHGRTTSSATSTDLLPADPRTGRTPDDASDAELLAAATTVVATPGRRDRAGNPRRGARPRRGRPAAAARASARDERPVVEVEQHAVGVLPVLTAQGHRLVAPSGRDQPQPQRADTGCVELGDRPAPPTTRGRCRRRRPAPRGRPR